MTNTTLTGPTASPRRERGLGYALIGGLGVTLLAVLLGAVYWLWFYTSQRSASPDQLLAPDTQLLVTLAPSLSDVPEGQQLASVLRDQVGVGDPGVVREGAVRLLGVDYANNVLTWIGSTMVVTVRDFGAAGPATAERLLAEGEVVFMISSRNDPQAQVFIEKHLAARAARGDRVVAGEVAGQTVYVQEGGAPSPIAAFTLFEHYIIFSNRPEAIAAMVERLGEAGPSLGQDPAFAQFSERLTARVPGGRYMLPGDDSQAALAALRDLLERLGE